MSTLKTWTLEGVGRINPIVVQRAVETSPPVADRLASRVFASRPEVTRALASVPRTSPGLRVPDPARPLGRSQGARDPRAAPRAQRILRRQAKPPRYEAADRALLAMLS